MREKTSFSHLGCYTCFGDSEIYVHTDIKLLTIARQNTHARTHTKTGRACHKLLGNFLATFRISSNFFCFEQLFAFLAISSFLDIEAAFSAVIGHIYFHILQCCSRQLVNFFNFFKFLKFWYWCVVFTHTYCERIYLATLVTTQNCTKMLTNVSFVAQIAYFCIRRENK